MGRQLVFYAEGKYILKNVLSHSNTALTTLAIPSVVVPQHAVIPLNAESCLCSLGIRYRTGCFFVGSREYSLEFAFFT